MMHDYTDSLSDDGNQEKLQTFFDGQQEVPRVSQTVSGESVLGIPVNFHVNLKNDLTCNESALLYPENIAKILTLKMISIFPFQIVCPSQQRAH